MITLHAEALVIKESTGTKKFERVVDVVEYDVNPEKIVSLEEYMMKGKTQLWMDDGRTLSCLETRAEVREKIDEAYRKKCYILSSSSEVIIQGKDLGRWTPQDAKTS